MSLLAHEHNIHQWEAHRRVTYCDYRSTSNSSSSTNGEKSEKIDDDESEQELSTKKTSTADFGLFEMFDGDEALLL